MQCSFQALKYSIVYLYCFSINLDLELRQGHQVGATYFLGKVLEMFTIYLIEWDFVKQLKALGYVTVSQRAREGLYMALVKKERLKQKSCSCLVVIERTKKMNETNLAEPQHFTSNFLIQFVYQQTIW